METRVRIDVGFSCQADRIGGLVEQATLLLRAAASRRGPAMKALQGRARGAISDDLSRPPHGQAAPAEIAPETGVLSSSGRRRATLALMIATAMQAFDATIANVALPQLERGLRGGIDLGSWVMTSYLCAAAVMALMTGWCRRRWGSRPIFIAAIGLFVLASSLCALATAPGELILFRLIQGAAAGIIQPLAQAIILDLYPKRDHGRMLAVWGATIMAGPMLGPLLGGVITDLASWRWIFAINAPIGGIAILGLGSIPSRATPDGAAIDRVGIALMIIAISSLQLALERSVGRLWPPGPETLIEAAVAIVAFGAIALQSRRSRFRLFRLELFRDGNFALATAFTFLIGALLFTTIVFVPALSEGPLGADATEAGLAIAPRGVGTMLMMLAMRLMIDRFDHRALIAIGLVVTGAALELMSWVPSQGGEWWLGLTGALQGIGVGMLFPPLAALAFSTLGADLRTDAAGVYSLSRQLGCAAGVAVMTAVLQARIESGVGNLLRHGRIAAEASMPALPAATFAAYTDCFRTLAIGALVMIPGVMLFHCARRAER
jgi:MFS transporter, DHA2 family, multidrug resistance protein